MDERIPRTLATAGSSDAEFAHVAEPQSDHSAHPPAIADANSTVVYCGDAEDVREGFWLALSLMQASGNLLMSDAAPPAGHLIQEDN
jgi:hypothetical protein